ncbi:ribosome small subunit-dependent GTPase A [Acaryochloris sp. IP29b_bin.148]|uniref:ribosome small subunit-dependent GTPase A n=1 Tax=Acaryochloris sp. IP29b_bin.148 TaxID=2969218 RepID=UPI002636FE46|nr:ribosome small subunit-dependent GTPase A [Acaryochloris sp. IP29b_bin.148]
MNLELLGWSHELALSFEPFAAQQLQVGRVARQHQQAYTLYTQDGERMAKISGKLRHQAHSAEALPCVGDWVAIQSSAVQTAIIHHILPRRTQFSRKLAGTTTEMQLVATNIDSIFLLCGLDHEFNLRRIERYLVMIWESGANPVIVLNKVDLCEQLDQYLQDLAAIALGVPVIQISALHHQGLEALESYLQPGQTVALLGSSGVGKSTLTNQLMEEEIQAVQAVRADDSRGRHTTTSRQLMGLPSGAVLIDTPGMRELQLWTTSGVSQTFAEIETLATQCRFRDCQHQQEPGCAVQAALADGRLDIQRLQSYQKLQREEAYLQRKQDQKAQLNTKARWKQITKSMRRRQNSKWQ